MRVSALILSITACIVSTSCTPETDGSHYWPESQVIAYIPSKDTPVCAITKMVDGDTVYISCEGHKARSSRLIGYDTPETFRPGCIEEKQLGNIATNFLAKKLKEATIIQAKYHGTDKYRRGLVELTLDKTPLEDIMVKSGLAVYNNGEKRINWCKKLRGNS